MQREFKFREPLYSDGKFTRWHYWGFIDDNFIGPVHLTRKHYQFTGRNDEKGAEIYEGDILPGGWIVVWHTKDCCYELVDSLNDNAAREEFVLVKNDKVIGNQLENPELVEA